MGCTSKSKDVVTYNKKEELIIKEFQHQLIKDLEDDNINGSISAAIVRENKIIWSRAFGYKNDEVKCDSLTIYRIGSITKTFTAFLMMRLKEEGIINLDDSIEKYVPEVTNIKGYNTNTKFTFKQLANHTSGLNREPDFEEAYNGSLNEWDNKVLQSLKSKNSVFLNYSKV